MKVKNLSFFTLLLSTIFIFNSGFLVIGHRGDPSKYPEETIQSDNSAFENGADYVELDLHVSKDNVLVVSHDRDLSRVVGSSVIVSQNNFSYLHSLKQSNGENIISLDELFQYYQNKPNTKFLIETKKTSHGYPKNMEKLLAQSIKKYHMQNRVMIHSFSADSLEKMSKLLPSVPRFFIVGSLKRINFEVLSYVTGVNISYDLITENPDLISQLHKLNKKVLVWAEMNESPKLWNWLINNDIDGVVTNFPATGYKYKLAKNGTKKFTLNKSGYYFGKQPLRATENPYIQVQTKTSLKFLDPVHISAVVVNDDKTFYQIGEHDFVPADAISFDLTPETVLPYWNLNIISKPNKFVKTYQSPTSDAKQVSYLHPNHKYQILAVNGGAKINWILTNQGWVSADDILYYGLFNQKSANFKAYQKLPVSSRVTNIALLPTLTHNRVVNCTFWNTYRAENAIIYNDRQ